jgi:isoquinoline 1-oxidoreductase beta subunit
MKFSRRNFLIGTGLVGGGLILGFHFKPGPPIPNTISGSFQPNAWLQVTEDGRVIFQVDKAEMGQGVMTSLAVTIGEELDYNPANILIEFAGVHPAFNNAELNSQVTGGSTSTKSSFLPLREAGATARALLVKAAAASWGVDVASCTTDDGKVQHQASNRSATYGELAGRAKTIRDVGAVPLKEPKDFRWIGKSVPRLDVPDKVNGKAVFGMDIDLPGMKIAVIRRCPQAGGSIKQYDSAAVEKMDGVRKVFTVHSGIAVVADSYWQARKAADALQVTWEKGPLGGLDSAAIRKQYEKALVEEEGGNESAEGDVTQALAAGAKKLDSVYATPYFHHSPMEPQNTTAVARDGVMEVWCPSQAPDLARELVALHSGFAREKIMIHTTQMGGGFGRRAYVDFAGEAGEIAAKYPDVPVKLVWSREEDMQHDFFRGYTMHRLEGAVDAGGNITAWQHRVASASIVQGFLPLMFPGFFPGFVTSETGTKIGKVIGDGLAGVDASRLEGAHIPYAIPHRKLDAVYCDPGIPIGFWRSVGHFPNAFAVECFIDELAHAAGKDPATARRELLQGHPRHLRVLEEVLTMSNWGKSSKKQGIAVHESFGSFVAMVVEVSVEEASYRVDQVFVAVDCGLAVHPDIITQQMESGIAYGLTAAMKAPVTFKDGVVEQSNFHDLPILRIDEMPAVQVSIIPSSEPPGGIGETGVPPITPALGNALFAATGQRLRELPFRLG